jgi:endonuclease/exonuclease/phosphatase family metal-dependent hydrolase
LAGVNFSATVSAQTRTLRIVTYNIEADIGVTNKQATFTNVVTSSAEGPPLPGLIAPPNDRNNVAAGGVLEGIGEELVNGNAQPLDILALQETASNPQTVAPIVNGLNTFYGIAGMYSNSAYQATQVGGNGVGNGPNAIVFNTRTMQLLASVPVDPPGGSGSLGSTFGEYREVMRYEFAPAGVAPTQTNEFYIYVSHYKSGGSGADLSARKGEAQIIRTNEAIDLSAIARVLYVGDYNITSNGEASYQIILSNTAPNGIQQAAAVDPFYPANNQTINWHTFTTDTNILAQESDNCEFIQYRDDLQTMTTNVFSGAAGGLKYIAGTYHTFGNNGSIAYQASVNNAANNALKNLVTNGPAFITAAQLYVDLTGAADHLPVVADYTIPLPAPLISSVSLDGTNLVLNVANSITGGVFTVLMSTNISLPLTNWMALATNTATNGSFTLTATTAVNPAAPNSFFILQEK